MSQPKESTAQTRVANLSLWVNDIHKSRQFFTDIVGLTELGAETGEHPYVTYGEKGVLIFALVQAAEALPRKSGWARWPANPDANDSWEPYRTILVPNLEEVLSRCRKYKVEMRQDEPVSFGNGLMVFIEVKDPDGNTWALRQA